MTITTDRNFNIISIEYTDDGQVDLDAVAKYFAQRYCNDIRSGKIEQILSGKKGESHERTSSH